MYTSIKAVAIRTVKHNDRSSILNAWSPSLGRLSIVMPSGNGAESRRRRALTMPLCMFECEADVRPNSEFLVVRDMRRWSPDGRAKDVSAHPVRSAVAMFVAEVLGVVTREGDGDNVLWQLIVDTVSNLSDGNGAVLANLPVMFLLQLASTMGIAPDMSDWKKGYGLDKAEGVICATRPMHDMWVSPDRMRVLSVVLAASRAYAHAAAVRLPRKVRAELLDETIDYFTIHHFPLDRMRSLQILKNIFD